MKIDPATMMPIRNEPTTWIPSPHNPSKLREHYWNGKEWVPTCFCKFVPLKG